VLGHPDFGVTDNFFDLGGHSLLALRLATRLCQVFRVEIPLKSLLELPTMAQLARRIEAILWAASNKQSSLYATTENQKEGVL
jgi:hypothetical protein